MTRLKIALLAGGDSPEREIALQSAALIEAALDHSKYDITVVDLLSLIHISEPTRP